MEMFFVGVSTKELQCKLLYSTCSSSLGVLIWPGLR